VTTMTNTFFPSAPLLNMEQLGMVYSVYFMTRDYSVFADPSYFSFSISQFIINVDKEGNRQFNNLPIEFENCSKYYEHFEQNGVGEDFNKNNLQLGICFNNKNRIIGGNFYSDYFSNILYTIDKCQNKTNGKIKCKSKEEIADKLKGGFFQFYYIEKNIDTNNYTNPFSSYFKSFFVLLDPNSKKFMDIYIKVVNVTSDVGLIFEEKETKMDIVFDYFREQTDSASGTDQVISFYINSSNNVSFYSRTYLKFQDVAASLGGILKALLFLASILTPFLTEYKMYEYMINTLFHVVKDDKRQTGSFINIKSEINVGQFSKIINSKTVLRSHQDKIMDPYTYTKPNLRETKVNIQNPVKINNEALNSYSNNGVSPSINKKILEKEVNNLFQKQNINHKISSLKNKIKASYKLDILSLFKIFCLNCCSEKAKNEKKLLTVIKLKLFKYLDYLKIIKTLQEFHKMKKILFNKTQKTLFAIYDGKVINQNNLNLNEEDEFTKKKTSPDNLEIYDEYIKAKQLSENDIIYKRLLENFDENLKMVFESL